MIAKDTEKFARKALTNVVRPSISLNPCAKVMARIAGRANTLVKIRT